MKTLGALFQLAAAGGVAWLWAHGYFTQGLEFAQGLLQQAPALTPFQRPGSALKPQEVHGAR